MTNEQTEIHGESTMLLITEMFYQLERERDEALKRVKDCGSHMIQVCEELEAGEGMIAVDAAIIVMGKLKRSECENERLKNFADNVHAELLEAREESLEQARLLGVGGEREARLITERNHYKQALEEIATTIQEYKDSIVQEPSEDFIWAIKAWADKKLREI
jgi:hypothetical protein